MNHVNWLLYILYSACMAVRHLDSRWLDFPSYREWRKKTDDMERIAAELFATYGQNVRHLFSAATTQHKIVYCRFIDGTVKRLARLQNETTHPTDRDTVLE